MVTLKRQTLDHFVISINIPAQRKEVRLLIGTKTPGTHDLRIRRGGEVPGEGIVILPPVDLLLLVVTAAVVGGGVRMNHPPEDLLLLLLLLLLIPEEAILL